MKKTKKGYSLSLHKDLVINTRSNKIPRKIVGYLAEPAGVNGGRLWRVHKNGDISWVCDTHSFYVAHNMAIDLDVNYESI